MGELATSDQAFIRPSPSAGHLGGVARATRESMLVLEAAGFDVVLVETVGVGQSEVAVHGMTDTFLMLQVARTGDQLQGIKRGILELADVIGITKADGDNLQAARVAARELAIAMKLITSDNSKRRAPVLTCSSATLARASTRSGTPSRSTGRTSRRREPSPSGGGTSNETGCGTWSATS